jgi:hypothetical protein
MPTFMVSRGNACSLEGKKVYHYSEFFGDILFTKRGKIAYDITLPCLYTLNPIDFSGRRYFGRLVWSFDFG